MVDDESGDGMLRLKTIPPESFIPTADHDRDIKALEVERETLLTENGSVLLVSDMTERMTEQTKTIERLREAMYEEYTVEQLDEIAAAIDYAKVEKAKQESAGVECSENFFTALVHTYLVPRAKHPGVVPRYQCRPSGMYEIEDDGGRKREPDDEEVWILADDYDRDIRGVVMAMNPWEPGTTNARIHNGEPYTVTDSGTDDYETPSTRSAGPSRHPGAGQQGGTPNGKY